MPEKLDPKIVEKAIKDYEKNDISVKACANKYNIGATTLTKYLNNKGINTSNFDTRKYKYNKDFFEVINTEEKAYWLGFIAADGSLVNNARALEITLSEKDKNHLYKFLNSINGEEEMIKDRLQKAGNKRYPSTRITVCNTKVVEDLKKYGIVRRKSFVLEFPILEQKLLRHYLRGYFDGDGSISTNGRKRNGSLKYAINLIATRSFLEKFMIHMMEYGITTVKLQNRGPISIWNKVGIRQIEIVLNYLYKESTIYLDRKYQLYKKILPS